jgi:DnaJ-domain-containing protein 1
LLDRLFDRLGELLRSLGIVGGPPEPGGRASTGNPAADPFLREAEQELEDYLRTGSAAGPGPERAGSGRQGRGPAPEALRRDFANLGLEPSASLEQVRRAHRQLLSRYHPDRFAGDPEMQRLSTRIAQILNDSFRRIQDYRR